MSFNFKLWGVSDLTVMTPLTLLILAIYLKLRSYFVFDSGNVILESTCPGIFNLTSSSVSASALVELESCRTNPISGFLAFLASLGTTTLNLNVFSSRDLSSEILLI